MAGSRNVTGMPLSGLLSASVICTSNGSVNAVPTVADWLSPSTLIMLAARFAVLVRLKVAVPVTSGAGGDGEGAGDIVGGEVGGSWAALVPIRA